jgi:hypothetical protein
MDRKIIDGISSILEAGFNQLDRKISRTLGSTSQLFAKRHTYHAINYLLFFLADGRKEHLVTGLSWLQEAIKQTKED